METGDYKEMTAIKMVAIDLDDTLLRDDITISEHTIRTVGLARKKGVEVVIATGRMFSTARPYGKLLKLGDIPMMLYSGALIQTVDTGRILYHKPIGLEAATKLLALAKERGWFLQTYIDDVVRVPYYNHYIEHYENITGTKALVTGDSFYVPCGQPSKMLVHGTKAELEQIKTEIEMAIPGVFKLMRSKDTMLEVIQRGVSKGTGLHQLCNLFHIELEQTLAIGNSQNDMAMLEAAGISVAVANAEPEIRKAADYVTTSNNEDGVAAAIEKYIL